MHYDIAMAWADKLESDEYKQTYAYLHNEQGFCCLGVLSDMFVKSEHNHDGLAWGLISEKGSVMALGYKTGLLPIQVQKWAGLKSYGGDVSLPPTQPPYFGHTLSTLNDREVTFSEIAKLIRKHWEYL